MRKMGANFEGVMEKDHPRLVTLEQEKPKEDHKY